MLHRTPLLALIAALTLPVIAQTPAGSSRVQGRIVSTTGEGVSKAAVMLIGVFVGPSTDRTNYVGRSGSDGSFAFEGVAAGQYSINVQKDGYQWGDNRGGFPAPPEPVEVAPGESVRGITLVMTPNAVVSGTVTDSDGDPLSAAQVQLARLGYSQSGTRQLQRMNAAQTDDRGYYRVANVQPGRYYVLVNDFSSRAFGDPSANVVYTADALDSQLQTYYPSALDLSRATAIDLDPGERLESVDIRMISGRLYAVRGQVAGADVSGLFAGSSTGPPLMQLTLTPKDPSVLGVGGGSGLRPDGSFEFVGLPPGDYILRAVPTMLPRGRVFRVPGEPEPDPSHPEPEPLVGRLDLRIANSDLDGVTLRLSSGAELRGRITVEGGGDLASVMNASPRVGQSSSPFAVPAIQIAGRVGAIYPGGLQAVTPQIVAANGTVISGPVAGGGNAGVLTSAPPRPSIRVMLMDADGFGIGGSLHAAVAEDGTFHISGIPPSQYLLNLEGPMFGYFVSSISLGMGASQGPLDLTNGVGGELQIVLSNRSGGIHLVPPEGAPGTARVSIWPKARTPVSTQAARQFQFPGNGPATLPGLPPGDYYVAAWENYNPEIGFSYPILEQFNSQAAEVEVTAGGTVQVEPPVISQEAVDRILAQLP